MWIYVRDCLEGFLTIKEKFYSEIGCAGCLTYYLVKVVLDLMMRRVYLMKVLIKIGSME